MGTADPYGGGCAAAAAEWDTRQLSHAAAVDNSVAAAKQRVVDVYARAKAERAQQLDELAAMGAEVERVLFAPGVTHIATTPDADDDDDDETVDAEADRAWFSSALPAHYLAAAGLRLASLELSGFCWDAVAPDALAEVAVPPLRSLTLNGYVVPEGYAIPGRQALPGLATLLARCAPALRELRVSMADIGGLSASVVLSPQDIAAVFGSCRHLRRLELTQFEGLGDAEVAALVQACPALQHVALRQSLVGSKGLGAIARGYAQLQSLDLLGCIWNVDDAAMQAIAGTCRLLQTLELQRTRVTDAGPRPSAAAALSSQALGSGPATKSATRASRPSRGAAPVCKSSTSTAPGSGTRARRRWRTAAPRSAAFPSFSAMSAMPASRRLPMAARGSSGSCLASCARGCEEQQLATWARRRWRGIARRSQPST